MKNVEETITDLAGKYLTFVLGRESYAIPVLKVREIIRLTMITPVPKTPAHIKGIINLRGKIVPVLDLCTMFGIQDADYTENSCIVVVQVKGTQGQQILLGLSVNAVEEVCNFANAEIEETPDFGVEVDTACILGMAKYRGKVKTLLDIDQILSSQTLDFLGSAA